MRYRAHKIVLAVILASVLAVFFQNCGKGFNAEQTGLAGMTSSYSTDPTPFAFDMTFDQISYNSCFGPHTAGREGFFTIAAGAYSSGGVALTSSFMNYVKTSGVVRPAYPSTEITDLQIKQYLYSNPGSRGAQPQMALRTRGNPQQIRTPNGDNASEGIDFFTMLGSLADDRWMDPLVKKGAGGVVNYFNLAPGGQRLLEARLTYNKDEGTAQGLRDDLRHTGMLALTYKASFEEGEETAARAVYDTASGQPTTNVFGRGYNLTFGPAIAPYTRLYGASTLHTLNPENILVGVQEVDLANPGSQGGSWLCHESRRYVVVRAQDSQHCPKDPYSYLINGIPSAGVSAAAYRAELEVVRRHLKPEFWDVSVERKCAVPKEGMCYQNETIGGTDAGIEYDQSQPCYQSLEGIPYSSPVPRRRCAQYVSICTRN